MGVRWTQTDCSGGDGWRIHHCPVSSSSAVGSVATTEQSNSVVSEGGMGDALALEIAAPFSSKGDLPSTSEIEMKHPNGEPWYLAEGSWGQQTKTWADFGGEFVWVETVGEA